MIRHIGTYVHYWICQEITLTPITQLYVLSSAKTDQRKSILS